MTEKQRRFAEELLSNGGNGAAAYRAAFGVAKARSAPQRLLRKPHVVAYLKQVRDGLSPERSTPCDESAPSALVAAPASAAIVRRSRDEVLAALETNLARAMQIEPVRDAQGNPTGTYRYDGAVANRSLELIARIQGYLVDRRELLVKCIGDLTDDELRARRDDVRRQLAEERCEEAEMGASRGSPEAS